MNDLKSLSGKRLSKDGTKVVFAKPSVVFLDSTETIAEHTVDFHEVGRIDFISQKYYSDTIYVDYILKFNNISNPFAVNFGDVLLIPAHIDVLAEVPDIKMTQVSSAAPSIKDQFIDTKRLAPVDASRVEYLKRKAKEKSNGAEPLPPNILQDGESNLTINNGTITI